MRTRAWTLSLAGKALAGRRGAMGVGRRGVVVYQVDWAGLFAIRKYYECVPEWSEIYVDLRYAQSTESSR